MKKIKIILGLLVITLLTLIGVISSIDINDHKEQITQFVKDKTGRDLVIDGNLSLALSLTPTIVVEKATLSNADWGSQTNMLELDKFELEVALMPLLEDQLQIYRLILLSPKIVAEVNDNGVSNWLLGKQETNPQTSHSSDDINSIWINDLLIKDALIVQKDLKTGITNTLAIDEVAVHSTSATSNVEVKTSLKFNEIPVAFFGTFGSLNQLLGNQSYPIDVAVNSHHLNANIFGEIKQPLDQVKAQLKFELRIDDPSGFTELTSMDLTPLTPLYMSADVKAQKDNISLSNLALNSAESDLNGEIAVSLANTLPSISADLRSNRLDIVTLMSSQAAQTTDEAVLADDTVQADEEVNRLPLDFLKRFNANIKLAAKQVVSEQVLLADTVIHTELKDGDISVTPFSSKFAATTAEEAVYSDLFGELHIATNQEVPQLTAKLSSSLLDVTGFEDVAPASEGEATKEPVEFSIDELPLAKLKLLNADIVVNTKVVKTSFVNLFDTELAVKMLDGDVSINPIKLIFSDAKNQDAQYSDLAGNIDITTSTKPLKLDAKLASKNLDITFLQNEQQVEGQNEAKPFDMEQLAILKQFDANIDVDLTQLSTSTVALSNAQIKLLLEGGQLSLNPFQLQIKNLQHAGSASDLAGDLSFSVADEKPNFVANLVSHHFDIVNLAGPTPETDKLEKEDAKSDKIFPNDPILLDALDLFNADINLSAKQVVTPSLPISNTLLSMSLQDGALTMKPLNTVIAGGSLKGELSLDNHKNNYLITDLSITGLQPEKVVDIKDKLKGAKTDITLNIEGSGKSVSEIMAGLNGKVLVQVAEGQMPDSALGALGTDLLSAVNPFSADADTTLLECAVVNLSIKDGLATADNGIALSTDKMNIIGNGTINLKDETLSIDIKPEPKEGIGISAGKLASLVKLGGTLANPTPTTDAAGVLTTGASAATAVATGGLSLVVEGLLDRATADYNACDTALGIKPTPMEEPSQQVIPAQ